MTTTTPQEAVGNYLTFLRDPEELRDEARIAEARAAYQAASDPIERLRLYSDLLRLEDLPVEFYEAAFVENAKEMAESEGITVASFRALGVGTKMLRKAGLLASK